MINIKSVLIVEPIQNRKSRTWLSYALFWIVDWLQIGTLSNKSTATI